MKKRTFDVVLDSINGEIARAKENIENCTHYATIVEYVSALEELYIVKEEFQELYNKYWK